MTAMSQPSDFSDGERLLSILQVAQRLGICRAQVYKLINTATDDRLPVVRIGRSKRISQKTLEEWIQGHEH
jgi:excisionase family DNA binding protein